MKEEYWSCPNVKVLAEMPEDKRKMHRIHMVTIISTDSNSYLPVEMNNAPRHKSHVKNLAFWILCVFASLRLCVNSGFTK